MEYFTAGGWHGSRKNGCFCFGGSVEEGPVICESAENLYRHVQGNFHVYRISPRCKRLTLEIPDEQLESRGAQPKRVRAPKVVHLDLNMRGMLMKRLIAYLGEV